MSSDLRQNRALLCALEIASMPSLAYRAREQSLPDGVLEVIRIAAGCDDCLDDLTNLGGKDRGYVRAAAELYLQEILLYPGADIYRVLGVEPGASREEMRLHLRWLMIWLHPDHARTQWKTVFAKRVLTAWRDAQRSPSATDISKTARRHSWSRLECIQRHRHRVAIRRRMRLPRSLILVAVAMIFLALIAPGNVIELGSSWLAAVTFWAVDLSS